MNTLLDIFWRFLLLGLTSFGGPAAHMGYFQQTFVQKLKWIDDDSYGKLIALSQFLPGPGSSQVGFAIGLHRGGLAGGIAASLGFTLPSFVLMYLLATTAMSMSNDYFLGAIHGLKLLAVVVIADACLTMSKSFCTNTVTVAICVFTAAILLVLPGIATQLTALLIAGTIGAFILKPQSKSKPEPFTMNWPALLLFLALFLGLPAAMLLANHNALLHLTNAFYQSGSLVFGGGHVVLPLLQESLGDSLSTDELLLGYAAAQAVPGPMFTMATFLGAKLLEQQPLLGATIATLAIFLPGFLLVLSVHKYWQALANRPLLSGFLAGINAAVIGLLVSTLYQPVLISSVKAPYDIAAIILGFFALRTLKLPIVMLVISFAFFGFALALLY